MRGGWGGAAWLVIDPDNLNFSSDIGEISMGKMGKEARKSEFV